jgi:hypothetical protein
MNLQCFKNNVKTLSERFFTLIIILSHPAFSDGADPLMIGFLPLAHTFVDAVSIELRNAGNLALDFVARAAELYQLPSLRRNTSSLVMGRGSGSGGSGSEAGEDGKVCGACE